MSVDYKNKAGVRVLMSSKDKNDFEYIKKITKMSYADIVEHVIKRDKEKFNNPAPYLSKKKKLHNINLNRNVIVQINKKHKEVDYHLTLPTLNLGKNIITSVNKFAAELKAKNKKK